MRGSLVDQIQILRNLIKGFSARLGVTILVIVSSVSSAVAAPPSTQEQYPSLWRDVAKDPTDPCLYQYQPTQQDWDLITRATAEMSELEALRTGGVDRKGRTYKVRLQEILTKYLYSNHPGSDAFVDDFIQLVEEESLRQNLFITRNQGPESRNLENIIRKVRLGGGFVSVEKLNQVMQSLRDAVATEADLRIQAVEADPDLSSGLSSALVAIIGQRDLLFQLMEGVRKGLIARMTLQSYISGSEWALIQNHALMIGGAGAVLWTSIAAFGYSLSAVTLLNAIRTVGTLGAGLGMTRVGAQALGVVGGSMGTGAVLGAIGDAAYSAVASRVENYTQAWSDSRNNGTSFGCELHKNHLTHPTNTTQQMIDGAISGAMFGATAVTAIMVGGKIAPRAVKLLVWAAPGVVFLDAGVNVSMAVYVEMRRWDYINAYRANEAYALAIDSAARGDLVQTQENILKVKAYLAKSTVYNDQADQLEIERNKRLVTAALESAVLFTAAGEIKHAVSTLTHNQHHIYAFVSKAADNFAVAVSSLTQSAGQLKQSFGY